MRRPILGAPKLDWIRTGVRNGTYMYDMDETLAAMLGQLGGSTLCDQKPRALLSMNHGDQSLGMQVPRQREHSLLLLTNPVCTTIMAFAASFSPRQYDDEESDGEGSADDMT
jgi:hypothetical protein